jgi:hypothetical protein
MLLAKRKKPDLRAFSIERYGDGMNTARKITGPHVLLAGVTVLLLGGLTLFRTVPAAGGEDRLYVVVSSAGLTVEAENVSVEEILRDVGAQVGFSVTAKVMPLTLRSISVKDASVEEVLQQLLRGENYALVYRQPGSSSIQASGGIKKVLLLSPPASATAGSQGQGQVARPTLVQSQQPQTPPPSGAQTEQSTATVFSSEGWTRLQERAQAVTQDGAVTATDLLEAQAAQILAAQNLPGGEQSAEGTTEQAAVNPAEGVQLKEDEELAVQRAMAVTTQLAQRNLAALVEGLAVTTSSLYKAQGNPGQPAR